MAAPTQNTTVRPGSESKSAKKKKAKTESSVAEIMPAVVDTPTENTHGDGANESPYVKELQKTIRNINKKITNASKVDNIVAENPGLSLTDLVAARTINADQKAQLEKKPALQAQLIQLQEQIATYKRLEDEFKARLETEKADFEKIFTERATKDLEEKVAAAKAEVIASSEQEQRADLLLLSQFLRLAAIRRGDEEADVNLDENKALEGVLSQVYTGDLSAVTTMVNLIQGSQQTTVSISAEPLQTTFAQIKAATIAAAPPTEEPAGEADESVAVETSEYPAQSDPTIANAGLPELDAPSVATLTDGHESRDINGAPPNPSFGEGGNAAAEANLDNANDLSTSQEWVEVPRDATETDTTLTSTPAASLNVQSWADDQPDSPEATPAPPNPNDGFHEVQRSRGGNRGDGQRGRGRGGDRGRGGNRGEYRGRGRGGPRGGASARGGRRPEDS